MRVVHDSKLAANGRDGSFTSFRYPGVSGSPQERTFRIARVYKYTP